MTSSTLKMQVREPGHATKPCQLPSDADEPAWMVEHAREEQRQRLLRHRHDLEARLVKIREREQREKERYAKGIPVQKKTVRWTLLISQKSLMETATR